jgi:hypothetical protein
MLIHLFFFISEPLLSAVVFLFVERIADMALLCEQLSGPCVPPSTTRTFRSTRPPSPSTDRYSPLLKAPSSPSGKRHPTSCCVCLIRPTLKAFARCSSWVPRDDGLPLPVRVGVLACGIC